jgi:hypothetical protein
VHFIFAGSCRQKSEKDVFHLHRQEVQEDQDHSRVGQVTTLQSFFFVNNVFDKTLKVFVSGEHFQPSLTFASKAEPLTKWSLLNLSTPVMEQHTFKKCKQLLEYQHLLIIRHVWWSVFYSIFKYC